MRGVILAGGFGTRLQPMTKVTNKHLLPVYDRPMIYYPINTLVNAGITEIMILTGSEYAGDFINLLGDGSEFGANFTYRPQKGAGGIAQALGLCRDFVRNEPVAVILGDNIFQDDVKRQVEKFKENPKGAYVFLHPVPDATRFGVATIMNDKISAIEEKPKNPKTNLAVTGLYFYDENVWDIIDGLTPSDRGELEITGVNNWYVDRGLMNHEVLEGFWSDAGTPCSLLRSSIFVAKYPIPSTPKGRIECIFD